MAVWIPEVRVCPPELRNAALQVLYQRVPLSLRARLIEDVLRESQAGLIDLSGLWIACDQFRRFPNHLDQYRIQGALLTQALAGKAAAVWAPEVQPSLRRQVTAVALIRAALLDLRERGFRIAQAVLDESASRRGANDLSLGGLPRVTELLYLERDTRIPLEVDSPDRPQPTRLEWQSFNMDLEHELRALLQNTYRSSLDMPELEGVRSLDDIIEGHRASGRFVADRWQLGRIPGDPGFSAVVLLSEVADRHAWEVAYLGLVPAARGLGLGRQVLARALEVARPHVARLELAVDVRNHPATRLYKAGGFAPYDRRSVHLVVFPEAGVSSARAKT